MKTSVILRWYRIQVLKGLSDSEIEIIFNNLVLKR